MDIELNSVDSFSSNELFSSSPPTMPSDDGLRRRVRTSVLSYIAHNYLKVIKALAVIILIMFLVIIIIVSTRKTVTITVVETVTTNTTTTSIATTPSSAVNLFDAVIDVDKKMCTSCLPNGCKIAKVTFLEIQNYYCCKCMPDTLVLIRYEVSVLSGSVTLIFKTSLNVTESEVDSLPKLIGIDGTWDLILDGRGNSYLHYSEVQVHFVPDDD